MNCLLGNEDAALIMEVIAGADEFDSTASQKPVPSYITTESKKYKIPVQAISIIDEYLEHSRVMIFHNGGNEKVYISSADWMIRNIDHRIEAACPVLEKELQQELKDLLNIQLHDNIKAREIDNDLSNQYINPRNTKKVRSQVETYYYLYKK